MDQANAGDDEMKLMDHVVEEYDMNICPRSHPNNSVSSI